MVRKMEPEGGGHRPMDSPGHKTDLEGQQGWVPLWGLTGSAKGSERGATIQYVTVQLHIHHIAVQLYIHCTTVQLYNICACFRPNPPSPFRPNPPTGLAAQPVAQACWSIRDKWCSGAQAMAGFPQKAQVAILIHSSSPGSCL